MRSEEVYNTWKDRKNQVDVSDGFADEVMSRVRQYERGQSGRLAGLRLFVDVTSGHPLAQVSLVLAGAIAGLIRFAFVVCMFLRC